MTEKDIKRDFGNEMCAKHLKLLIMECETCPGTLVCPVCILQTHNGHKFKDLKESASNKKDKINNFIETTEKETIPEINRRVQDTNTRLENNNKTNLNIINQLKDQANKLKKIIDDILQQSIEFVQNVTKMNETLLLSERSDLDITLKDITKKILDYKKVVKADKEVMIYDTAASLQKFDIPDSPVLSKSVFFPCEEPTMQIEKAMGMLKKVKLRERTFEKIMRNPSFAAETRVLSNTPRRKSMLKLLEYREKPKVLQEAVLPGIPWSIHPSKDNSTWVFLR